MAESKRSYRPTSETRQLLTEKALELMKKNGYQGTTVRAICSSLGLPTGTFYNCFKSKSEIFSSIYAMGDGYFADVVSKKIEGQSFPKQLEIYASAYAKVNLDTGIDLVRVLVNTENKWFSQVRPMQNVLMTIFDNGANTGYVTPVFDKTELVNMIFDILRGVCYDWCICDGAFDLEKRMLSHVRLLIPGMAGK